MRKLLASLVLCSAVLACDTRQGSSISAPFSAEVGLYTLQTVSGAPLPVTLAQNAPNTTRVLIADTLVLATGGNAREVYYVTTTTPPNPPATGSVSMAGKYTITRDSIHLPADFPYLYGRYTSGTITLYDAQGFIWVFKKP